MIELILRHRFEGCYKYFNKEQMMSFYSLFNKIFYKEAKVNIDYLLGEKKSE